jgi:dihydroorotase-like cyclic amidohydrolase
MEEYKQVHNQQLHYATIYKRNKLIASSRNSVGSRSRGSGWSNNTIHAEIAAVKRLGDLTKLQGCVLVVVRVNKQNELKNSKPCENCKHFLEKCMSKYGLLKVMYSS